MGRVEEVTGMVNSITSGYVVQTPALPKAEDLRVLAETAEKREAERMRIVEETRRQREEERLARAVRNKLMSVRDMLLSMADTGGTYVAFELHDPDFSAEQILQIARRMIVEIEKYGYGVEIVGTRNLQLTIQW